jgi:peptidoglycan/LPS O-acetylase OafA/YrhL
MTRIIVRDLKADEFNFLRFSTKRFWRLYPALLGTVAVTVVCASLLQPPDLVVWSARSALAALGFSSNVLFLREADYFDKASSLKPLMHTWSLGLEEQFYVVWPLVLRALTFWERPLAETAGVAVTGLASVAYCVLERRPSARFFLLPARLFEFAAGGLASFFYVRASSAPRALQEAVAAVSIAALVAAFFRMDEFDQYLSPSFLSPVLGTLGTILAPQSAVAARALSNPAVRWVGKISYSAYLVHWPLYVFSLTLLSADQIGGPPHIAALFAATLAGAVALHYLVETRLRYKRTIVQRVSVGVAWAAVVCVSMLAVVTEGWQRSLLSDASSCAGQLRATGATGATGAAGADVDLRRERNTTAKMQWTAAEGGGTFAPLKKRQFSGTGREVLWIAGNMSASTPAAYVFGTSYADHLVIGLQVLARARGELYVEQGHRHGAVACPLLPRNFSSWLSHPDRDTLMVGMNIAMTIDRRALCAKLTVARWAMLDAAAASVPAGGRAPVVLNAHRWETTFKRPDSATTGAFLGELCADVAAAGLRLAVVGTLPQTAHMTAANARASPPVWGAREGAEAANSAMAAWFAARPALRGSCEFVDMMQGLCGRARKDGGAMCLQRIPTDPAASAMYTSDGVHLSPGGSLFVAPIVNAALN